MGLMTARYLSRVIRDRLNTDVLIRVHKGNSEQYIVQKAPRKGESGRGDGIGRPLKIMTKIPVTESFNCKESVIASYSKYWKHSCPEGG